MSTSGTNRQAINYTTVRNLPATGKRYFVRDANLGGFGIEVSAKGKATYFVETRHNAKKSPVRKQIAPVTLIDLEAARQQARAMLLQASNGFDIRYLQDKEEPLPETLLDVLQLHAKEKRHTLSQATISDYRRTFENTLNDWRNLPTKQLTRGMVKERYLALRDTHSAAYVNKVFRNLRAILSYAGVSPNPCDILKEKNLRGKPTVRDRHLSGSEIYHLLEFYSTFRPKVLRLVLFILMTGLRRNEALSLRWQDVRDEKAFIHHTKNRKTHVIPLVGMIGELMGKRGKPEDLVFGYTDAQLRRAFDGIKEKLGFERPWTLHDLRRTFAEHLNLVGYSVKDIGIAINHSESGVTQTHYLSGQLAKQSLLRQMLDDLQKQYLYYQYSDGGEVMRVPQNWKPHDIKEREEELDAGVVWERYGDH